MIDGIIKGDGTSRTIKATLPATYSELVAQAAAGTLQADVLFNALGWDQEPTFLNKATLLSDATATLYGLSDSSENASDKATVNNALLRAMIGSGQALILFDLEDSGMVLPSGVDFELYNSQGASLVSSFTSTGERYHQIIVPVGNYYLKVATGTVKLLGYDTADISISAPTERAVYSVSVLVPAYQDMYTIEESGDYVLAADAESIDICIVGGGGGGGRSLTHSTYGNGGGGGGAGAFMNNVFSVPVNFRKITIEIGAAGSVGTAGGASSVIVDENTITASGGENGQNKNGSGTTFGTGGNGGTGGGGCGQNGGAGGSNGSNGSSGSSGAAGGTGDGLSKYPFGDETLPLCCGGGGGGARDESGSYGGAGGAGGGGKGGRSGSTNGGSYAGAAGTYYGAGGGGAGFSSVATGVAGDGYQGVVMIRKSVE